MGMGKKTTDLATGIPAVNDWVEYIDRDDTTMAPSGTNKKALFSDISAIDTDGTLAANSDTKIASQKATRTYIANVLAGVSKNKGALNCSANPNYPVALNGDSYRCSVAGKIGGASGVVVEVADLIVCVADNAGGTQAGVGTSWIVGQANITGITAAGLAMMQAADEIAQAALLAAALATYFSPSIVPYASGNLTGSVTLAIGNGGTQYGTQTGNITIQPPSGTPVAMVSKIELYVTGNGSTLDFDAAVIRASDSAATFPKTLTNGLVYLLQLRHYKSQWNLVSLVGGT